MCCTFVLWNVPEKWPIDNIVIFTITMLFAM